MECVDMEAGEKSIVQTNLSPNGTLAASLVALDIALICSVGWFLLLDTSSPIKKAIQLYVPLGEIGSTTIVVVVVWCGGWFFMHQWWRERDDPLCMLLMLTLLIICFVLFLTSFPICRWFC